MNSSNSKSHQIKVDSREFLGQSYQPKRHKVLIHDTQQESRKKSPSKLRQENHKKELRKSPKRKMVLTQNQHLTPSTQQAERSWLNTRDES
jgi:hypothetical protein